MTKSEMLKNWKETSAIKSEFGKVLGERFPHLCYTDTKLLAKVQKTLKDLTAELSQVKDGEAEKPVKAKKEEETPAETKSEAETKVGEAEVKVTKAKTKKEEAVKA